MTLLSIVLALVLERLLSHLQHWRGHALFARHVRWLRAHVRAPRLWGSPWVVPLPYEQICSMSASFQLPGAEYERLVAATIASML